VIDELPAMDDAAAVRECPDDILTRQRGARLRHRVDSRHDLAIRDRERIAATDHPVLVEAALDEMNSRHDLLGVAQSPLHDRQLWFAVIRISTVG
jgi:hypothetical protein